MRRVNGTGTVTKLPGKRRKPYAVRISYQDRFGQFQQKYLSYHMKSEEAQRALDAYNQQLISGSAPAPDKLDMTVRDVYEAWSSREYKKLKKQSITSHKAAWNKRVSRYADLKMRDVSLDQWQAILDDDEEAELSKSLINNDTLLIKALNSYAMERDIIGKDYSQYLDVPKVGAKVEKGSLSDLDIQKLKDMAADGFPFADVALILCYTGFRINELLDLTPFSYDPVDQVLRGGSKTQAGKDRVVPIHPVILPYIQAWLSKGGNTVICSEDGTRLPYVFFHEKALPPITKALGLPQATSHWFRHTCFTRLHAAGAPELEIKRILGHADKNVTEHYTHTDISQLTAAIRKLA